MAPRELGDLKFQLFAIPDPERVELEMYDAGRVLKGLTPFRVYFISKVNLS